MSPEPQNSWARGNDVSPIPPHPSPLPRGEGAPPSVAGKGWMPRYGAARRVLPLPKGEGRGEGNETRDGKEAQPNSTPLQKQAAGQEF